MKPFPKIALSALSFSTVNLGYADNQAMQDYLFLACASARGVLAQRCAITDNALGDVTGDSESSLNPSQVLSVSDLSLDTLRVQSNLQNEDESQVNLLDLELGPVGAFINLKAGGLDSERTVDVDREREYAADSFGFDIGVDYQLDQGNYLGIILGYETRSLNFVSERPAENFNPQGNAGGIDTESYSAMVFAHLEIGYGMFANVNAGYAEQSIDIERNAIFQELNRLVPQLAFTTTAETEGSGQWLAVDLGYRFEFDAWQVSPLASWTLSYAKVEGYTEQDLNFSGFNMILSDSSRNSSTGELGFAVSRVVNTGGVVLNPQFRMAYQREFARDPDTVDAKYVLDGSDSRLSLQHDDIDATQFSSAFSVSLVAPNGWLGFLDADLIWDNDLYSGWQLTGGIRKEI